MTSDPNVLSSEMSCVVLMPNYNAFLCFSCKIDLIKLSLLLNLNGQLFCSLSSHESLVEWVILAQHIADWNPLVILFIMFQIVNDILKQMGPCGLALSWIRIDGAEVDVQMEERRQVVNEYLEL